MKYPTDTFARGLLAQHAADLQHRRDAHQDGPRRCGKCDGGLCHGVPPVRRPGRSDRVRQLTGEGRKHDRGQATAGARARSVATAPYESESDVTVWLVSVYAPTVITVARVESELDYWFSPKPPACSVLWLMGDPQNDLAPALVRVTAELAPLRCGAASCVPWSRPRTLAGLTGAELLLEATTGFAATR